MIKNTSGPWKAYGTDVYRADGEGRICKAQVEQAYQTKVSKEEAQANAYLIAAAPELLSACKIAVKRLEEIRYQIASDKQVEFLKEIIAKAEGK